MQLGTQIIIDRSTTPNAEYIGKSAAGSVSSSPVWSIKKIIYDIDNKPLSISWAEGNHSQEMIWDNRASYTYK